MEKLITPGQLLQVGTTPCFTVADLSQVWVMANIFESDLAAVEEGDPAEIVTSASPTNLPGTVDYISAIVDPSTRAIGVRVVAKNPKDILKKQMYVRVLIHSRREQTGLLAPVSAVLARRRGPAVCLSRQRRRQFLAPAHHAGQPRGRPV